MSLDFHKLIKPISHNGDNIFKLDGYYVWCGTMTRSDDGLYYLYFSYWPREKGFNAWVTHSKVGYAVSEDPLGRFEYKGDALCGSGIKDGWDRDCIHNPTVIRYKNKYYLYYMGNFGNGEFWNNRNNQRVGVACADKPEGPWQRFDKPVLDVSTNSGAHDCLMTSNPTVTEGEDGRLYMIYKAVSNKAPLPAGGPVVCGTAIAHNPLGPFIKSPNPIMTNPEENWSVEDPFVWYQDGLFYALVKDFQAYFTKTQPSDIALFYTKDFVEWKPAENVLAVPREICYEDEEAIKVSNLERPQLYIEDGKPRVLLLACSVDKEFNNVFNIRLPLAY